jgi:hypothetical protein
MKVSLSKMFRRTIDEFLNKYKPSYDIEKKGTIIINERNFQYHFCKVLENYKFDIEIEDYYPNSNYQRKYDIMAKSIDNIEIYIELKWSAKLNDCFHCNIFSDLDKFMEQKLNDNCVKAFFAVNINNRYKLFPKKWKAYPQPLALPTKNEEYFGALKNCYVEYFKYKENIKLYLKRYENQSDRNYYNTLLFCYVSDINFL